MKNKTDVIIFGCNYTISAEEPAEYVEKVAKNVDSRMNEIYEDSGANMSHSMTATLVAVNLCDELFKSQQAADNLRTQLKKYLDDSARSRQEAEESRREIASLKSELERFKAIILKSDT